MEEYDPILVGAGLANTLIALRLQEKRPDLTLLLIETDEQILGNHTWSFHRRDLTPAQYEWIHPLVDYCWPGYDVRFPLFSRGLSGEYCSITSEQLAKTVMARLGPQIMTGCTVNSVTATQVRIDDGRIVQAHAVIDGRGFTVEKTMSIGIQAFVGQVWQLAEPHGLSQPILMDATVDQQQGYRFVYTLPLSATELLIEDTHYIDRVQLDPEQARTNIRDYAASQGWQLATLQREEQGNLPITLAGKFSRFWATRSVACSGLRAGLYHATTGYSLPHAVALADEIAQLSCMTSPCLRTTVQRYAQKAWGRQRFFRILNRMLFLAGPATQRRGVMQRFYRLNADLIARFYAGQLTLWDKLRIVSGKPPVPVIAALKAILKPLIK